MYNQQIEKALRLCIEGMEKKMAKCYLCPYIGKGCLAALMKDASRYIGRLKTAQNKAPNPPSAAQSKSHAPRKNGKPVQEWLKECEEEDRRKGVKDIGSIPW